MDVIYLEDESIHEEIFNSMAVSNEHSRLLSEQAMLLLCVKLLLKFPMYSGRILEAWRMSNGSFKRLQDVLWSILRSLKCLACLPERVCSFFHLDAVKLCWPSLLQMSVGRTRNREGTRVAYNAVW